MGIGEVVVEDELVVLLVRVLNRTKMMLAI